MDPEAIAQLAQICANDNAPEEAEELMRFAKEGRPPEKAATYNLLGALFQREHQYEESSGAYARAFEIDPMYAEAAANLSSVLYELGDYKEALAAAERAIELDPNLVFAHTNAAAIEVRMQRFAVAQRRMEELLKKHPDDFYAQLIMVQILHKGPKRAEAVEASEKLLAAFPDNPVAHEAHAMSLQMAQRHPEAVAVLEAAVPLAPMPGAIMARQAGVEMEAGNLRDARSYAERALVVEPDCAQAWYALTFLRQFTARSPELQAMEANLQFSPRLRSVDMSMFMHYALGRAYLSADLPECAFRHLELANGLKRAAIEYDVAADEKWFASLINEFGPRERWAKFIDHGQTSELPVFVLGMPRSGTSLVEQILASHPSVYGAGELSYLRVTVHDMVTKLGLFNRPCALDIEALAPEFRAMSETYIKRLRAEAPDALRIVDKMPANFVFCGLIGLILPKARIIHTKRDPLDTALSLYMTMFEGQQDFSYNLTEMGRMYRGYERLFEHWRELLPPEQFLEINYEDIVGDLEAYARKIVAFCGLPWDDACLRFHETKRVVRTTSSTQVRQPIYSSSVGRGARYGEYLKEFTAARSAEDQA